MLSFSKIISWAFLKGTFYGGESKALDVQLTLVPFLTLSSSIPYRLMQLFCLPLPPGLTPTRLSSGACEKNEQAEEEMGIIFSVCGLLGLNGKHLSRSHRFFSPFCLSECVSPLSFSKEPCGSS